MEPFTYQPATIAREKDVFECISTGKLYVVWRVHLDWESWKPANQKFPDVGSIEIFNPIAGKSRVMNVEEFEKWKKGMREVG
jgi:hypothetical protein